MKRLASLVLIYIFSLSATAQQTKDTLSIPEVFDNIYRTSTSYQEYKVVSKDRFQALKQQVSDSLNDLKKLNVQKSKQITSQKDSISELKKIVGVFESDLNQTIAQKNSIRFLGIEILKTTYNIMVWSFIALLVILLVVFIYRFNTSNLVTTKARTDLQELEEEFSIYKKKTLEREQKLRRQLQDEINKQRGV